MNNQLRGFLCRCILALAPIGVLVACSDSTNDNSIGGAGNGGSGGNGGGTANQGGNSEGGAATSPPDAGANAAGSAGAGGSSADVGADGSAEAGEAGRVACHVSWTGAATGGADCSNSGVCKRNFLSVHVYEPAAPAPIKSVQLVFIADNELAVGTFVATGVGIADTSIQTDDPSVIYEPQFDSVTHLLSGGTSMSLTVTSIVFSTDPNDVCSGVAHGSLDAVLRETAPSGMVGSKTLTVHANF